MSSILVLDDMDHRLDRFKRVFDNSLYGVCYCKTAAKANGMLSYRKYDLLFLDHDLLPEHYGKEHLLPEHDATTGFAVVKHLIENVPQENWPAQIILHSLNQKGVLRMYDTLTSKTKIRVVSMPFDTREFESFLGRIRVGRT